MLSATAPWPDGVVVPRPTLPDGVTVTCNDADVPLPVHAGCRGADLSEALRVGLNVVRIGGPGRGHPAEIRLAHRLGTAAVLKSAAAHARSTEVCATQCGAGRTQGPPKEAEGKETSRTT